LVAAALRLLLSPLDRRLLALRLPTLTPGRRRLAWSAGAVVLAAVALAAGLGGEVRHQYDRFVADAPTNSVSDPRARLGEVYNSHRIAHWDVAMQAWRTDPWRGVGAGTFDLRWNHDRPYPINVTQAHSLYVETLSELGVVGAVALAALLLGMVVAATTRWRRRPAAAAVLAVIAVWALHAAVDWDWEMPAVTAIPFLLAATAATVPARRANGGRRRAPLVIGVGALALAVVLAVSTIGELRVDQGLRAYDSGECATASGRANQARSLPLTRPEPYALLALCAARAGDAPAAVGFSRRAIAADPLDWEWRYLESLVTGATGGDPRAPLREAVRLNPRGFQPSALMAVVGESDPAQWAARAAAAYVWIHGHAHAAIAPASSP
jgi:hypothetical protein